MLEEVPDQLGMKTFDAKNCSTPDQLIYATMISANCERQMKSQQEFRQHLRMRCRDQVSEAIWDCFEAPVAASGSCSCENKLETSRKRTLCALQLVFGTVQACVCVFASVCWKSPRCESKNTGNCERQDFGWTEKNESGLQCVLWLPQSTSKKSNYS